jgi:DNA processing protein
MDNQNLLYQIGLTMIAGVGPVTAKKLVAYTGGVEAVFKESKKNLLKIPGIGNILAKEIIQNNILKQAAEEAEFVEKYKIKTSFYLDNDYPERLKHFNDSPILLYIKGETNLNAAKTLAIIGTRNATNYGKEMTEKLVEELHTRGHQITIISGLAYGIDICAHKAALKHGLPSIALLGHGLKIIYPSNHANIAKEMINNGALITEFRSNVGPDRQNFVMRNRIVAGMSDATVVVESGEKGGALITAEIANSYNRDVFAFPGKITDAASKGCNKLIKINKAALIESAEDLEYLMGWENNLKNTKPIQKQLFVQLQPEEQKVLDTIKEQTELSIDSICFLTEMPMSKVSSLLLTLEFSGLVKSLPGKIYKCL